MIFHVCRCVCYIVACSNGPCHLHETKIVASCHFYDLWIPCDQRNKILTITQGNISSFGNFWILSNPKWHRLINQDKKYSYYFQRLPEDPIQIEWM